MDKQEAFQYQVTQQLKIILETTKELSGNQTRILHILKHMDERQTHLQKRVERVESVFSRNTASAVSCSPCDSRDDVELGIQVGDMGIQIDTLEKRLGQLECKLKLVEERLHQEVVDDTSSPRLSLTGCLDGMEHLSLESLDTPTQNSAEDRGKRRKGSFKAASLAILFVNRLIVTEVASPVPVQEESGQDRQEKNGGDHLRAAGLAIVFMVRLLRMLQLPLVLDNGMEITPD